MGKQRKDKKLEANTQEPSSSSSKKNRKRAMDKTEKYNSQKEKKLKKEPKVQKSSMNDLPPEMLMKVLKNVDSESLVGCRLVSRKWNGIASEILQSRADLQLQFDCSSKIGTAKFISKRKRPDDERSLLSFIECFQNSNNFPFAHFCFREIDSSLLDQKDWIKFISDFGENIKCLKLGVNFNASISNDGDLTKLTEKVRDLLLIKLPELEKFGISLDYYHPTTHSSTIQLFPTLAENSKSSTSKVQLPHLKVLYLPEEMFSTHTEIVTDLLRASVNLQKLESFYNIRFTTSKNFLLLQSLGKLGCLEVSNICLDTEFFSKLDDKSSASLVFKLKKLNLSVDYIYEDESIWPDASLFISNLFESSKDTLTVLNMGSLNYLPDLELPKFSKVISLSMQAIGFDSSDPFSETFLPVGKNPMEYFPALHSLVLEMPWDSGFPNQDDVSSVPTLEILKVTGHGMHESCIREISLLFPNLKDLEISEDGEYPMKNFPKVGRAIWTHLKKLQSLVVYEDSMDDVFPAFDSCISGYSEADCKRLYNLLLTDKLLKENGSRVKVPKSELKAERIFPSILDLKDLKSFELHVKCKYRDFDDLDCDCDPDATKNGPTPVSEKLTLDLMDNLIYKIEKHY